MPSRKSNAPPQLIVLLWHHFCYYKRHKFKLIFTVLLPFVFLVPLYFLIKALTDGSIMELQKMKECQFPTKSSFSAGPLQGVLSAECAAYDPYDEKTCITPSQYSELNILDRILSGDIVSCLNRYAVPDAQFYEYANCYPWRYTGKLCVLFTKNIFYYPKDSQGAEQVMKGVKKRLQEYQWFIENSSLPEINQNAGNSSKQQLYKIVGRIIEAYKSQIKNQPEDRVVGFRNRDEVIEHTRNVSRNKNLTSIPNLWGVVSFEPADGDVEETFRYRIMYDYQADYKVDRDIAWLQDLLDDAVIQMKAGGSNIPFAPATKQLSNKCWLHIHEIALELVKYLITFGAIFSFLLSPSNFLEQVLTEKSLKLREYLYIMGVGNFTLKFSWILFYLIFLVPLAIVFALFVILMPYTFSRSDPSLIFVIILAYNICQLSFCYMLASALRKPGKTGILLAFLNLFFWLLSAPMFINANMYGVIVTLARVCSLYSATPMAIAFGYLTKWEAVWLGAQWRNLFYSPNLFDKYGGIGECLLWLVGDTMLYLFTAWYLEKVFPGDFGVKHQPYFLFQPSYWLPARFKKRHVILPPEIEEPDVEAASAQADIGIFLHGLTKAYGKNRIGVNHLTMDFYRNEITAFLGENGAGKSTTMNILVGLISATEGNAKVHNFDVQSQIDDIRSIVGFVPQYDILYPSTTVEEHLQFFGWLKGLSKDEIRQLTDTALEKLDLKNQKRNMTTSLSGGQKRKLSMLTAYMGNPDVIILDEPTSGVDPFSRRAIWKMILQRRKNATTVLSTHFMEEADILGDRIAIIAGGELRCSGSAMYLKNRYGKGMQLIVACYAGIQDKETVKNFVTQGIPSSTVVEEKGSDVIFGIPMEVAHSARMIEFLTSFEEQQESLFVTTYGLSESSLEDVFFAAVESKSTRADVGNQVENNEGIQMVDQQTSNRLQVTSDQIVYSTENGAKKLAWQAWGLIQKRSLYTVLSWPGYLLQIVLPLMFILLLLLIGKQVGSSGVGLKPVHIWQHYRDNTLFFQNPENSANSYITSAAEHGFGPRCPNGLHGFSCRSKKGKGISMLLKDPGQVGPFGKCTCSMEFCIDGKALSQANHVCPSKDKIYRISSGTNVTDWLIHANSSDQTAVGGFQFKTINKSNWKNFLEYLADQNVSSEWIDFITATTKLEYVTVWHKDNLQLGMVNVWNNLVLRNVTGNSRASIEMEIEEVRLVDISQDMGAMLNEYLAILVSSFFLDCCFAFGVFGIAVFVQYENSTGLKRLQFLFGANPIVYWVVNLVCDFLLYMVTVAAVVIVLAVFDNSYQDHVDSVLAVAIPYGFLSITFIYLLSFLFKGTGGIVIFSVIVFLVSLFAASIVTSFELSIIFCKEGCDTNSDPDNDRCKARCQNFPWTLPVSMLLQIFPGYFLTDGILLIAAAEVYNQFLQGRHHRNPFYPLLQWNILGRRIAVACIAGCLYLILVIILEYLDLRINLSCCRKSRHKAVNPVRVEDVDVQQETARVQARNLEDPLILRKLSKTYPHAVYPAVAGVTLGVPRSQCFGLLGINGAGKTTLFKMLTGSLTPTSGEAFLEGNNLFSKGWGRFAGASYCPQENTLFDSLSVRRHLQLFAKIRGVPKSHVDELVVCLAKEVGLTQHFSKRTGELSGGNQRKLQFAMSLLDYCPVIFLDEPTTGMDPGSRRNAWDVIKRAVNKGCSVVLTSHSMEECEALCHRLVIMVAGSFQCIGSVQYLKDKFGNKYKFKLKLSPDTQASSPSPTESVKGFILSKFPTATMIEEHGSVLQFEVEGSGLKLSQLFQVLSQCKEQFSLEDFTVSQITLEDVFINMARMQEMIQSGFDFQPTQSGQVYLQGRACPSTPPYSAEC